jgi:hypothetical protein
VLGAAEDIREDQRRGEEKVEGAAGQPGLALSSAQSSQMPKRAAGGSGRFDPCAGLDEARPEG